MAFTAVVNSRGLDLDGAGTQSDFSKPGLAVFNDQGLSLGVALIPSRLEVVVDLGIKGVDEHLAGAVTRNRVQDVKDFLAIRCRLSNNAEHSGVPSCIAPDRAVLVFATKRLRRYVSFFKSTTFRYISIPIR